MIVAATILTHEDTFTIVRRMYARLGSHLGAGWYDSRIILVQDWKKVNGEYSLMNTRPTNVPMKLRIFRGGILYSDNDCPGIATGGSWFKAVGDGKLIYREINSLVVKDLNLL